MRERYKAMQVLEPGILQIVDKVVPHPEADQVLIEVEACGVCGADLVDVSKESNLNRVPGHEVVGRIIAMGGTVSPRWRIGQRVGVGRLGGCCNQCTQCRLGRFNLCQAQDVVGVTCDGGYAEIMVARETGLVAIPDELCSEEAAPILCAGLSTFTGLRKSGAQPGDTVAILGIGGLGHMAIQYARKMGFRTVAIGRGGLDEKEIKHMGAHAYLDSANPDTIPRLQKIGGVQVLMSTINNDELLADFINILAPQGTLLLLGVGKQTLNLSSANLIGGEKRVMGSMTGTASDCERALDFSVLFDVLPRVETLPMHLANKGLEKLRSADVGFKLVLTMSKALSSNES